MTPPQSAAQHPAAQHPAAVPELGVRAVAPAPAAVAAGAVAAGAICWRRGRGNDPLEVLLVRRGDDAWGWPWGLAERGEARPECAVRLATAAAGAAVVLSRPLPSAGAVTEAAYWAVRVTHRAAQPRRGDPAVEPLERRWVPVEQARGLDAAADEALDAAADQAAAGTLATTATLVVRHATARPRDAWARADADRPLVAAGRRQAMALGALLGCWRPELVLSSPWRRCLDTMGPYLAASGTRLRTKGGLSEAGHRRDPDKAARHTRALLASSRGGALCTHRPVLATVLAAVRSWSAADVAGLLPDGNPYLHPGEALIAHVAHRAGRPPLVVAVERHGPR